MQTQSLVIESVSQIDLSEIKMPLFTIYKKPLDFPESYVARLFDLNQPTNIILLSDTLEGIRSKIPKGLYRFERDHNDVETIIETWG